MFVTGCLPDPVLHFTRNLKALIGNQENRRGQENCWKRLRWQLQLFLAIATSLEGPPPRYFCDLTRNQPAGENNHTMKLGRALLLLWAIGMTCAAQAKQLAVITDTGNATTNLTASELAKIFNAHAQNWPDGRAIKIVLRDPSSADMQLAVRKLFNMTADQARAFVRAHAEIIVVVDSDDAVIHLVSSTRGAIGLVDLYSLTKDVNVVKIDGKLPVEQGYLLRGN
jgi:hypothetical protein